jgi:hypothetical protein
VPDNVPSEKKVTPSGSPPELMAKLGVGHPLAVKLNVPVAPTANVVAVATLVIAGG